MKISILTPDLSHNCLGRAHVLARMLQRNHDIEIVGPILKDSIWSPLKDDYEYKSVKCGYRIYEFLPAVDELLNLCDGDIILASKPQVTSYGIGLLKRLNQDRPLILDIDDWESGIRYNRGKIKTYLTDVPRLINTNSFYYTRALEALSGLADARTVSNRFLQNKFGGEIIPHARDTTVFDPSRFDKYAMRRELDLPADENIIMFSGTPRPHKGVDNLIRAVSGLERDKTRLVLVGADDSLYVKTLRELGDKSTIIRGQQPFDEIPRWIAAADIIAIPQKDTPATRGQMPAKVYDAMAMGKPIVATAVSDLPEVLDGCGSVVDPGSEKQLQTALRELLESEHLRVELGNRARQKCIEEYSYDAVAPRITKVIESCVKNEQ